MTEHQGMNKAREWLKIAIEGFIEDAWEMMKTPGVKDTHEGKSALRERKELIQVYIKDCKTYNMNENFVKYLEAKYDPLKRRIDRVTKWN